MTREQKRRVYLVLGALVVGIFAIGLIAGYAGRNTPICKNKRAPVAQQPYGINQVEYLCTNGETVIK